MSKLFYTMEGPPRFGVVNFALAVFLTKCAHTHTITSIQTRLKTNLNIAQSSHYNGKLLI